MPIDKTAHALTFAKRQPSHTVALFDVLTLEAIGPEFVGLRINIGITLNGERRQKQHRSRFQDDVGARDFVVFTHDSC